jgi:hypothetical protein
VYINFSKTKKSTPMNYRTKFFLPAIIFSLIFWIGCDKDSFESSDDFTENTYAEIEIRDELGSPDSSKKCFEWVFPVTLLFPDETETEIETAQDLREELKTWRDENRGEGRKPRIELPNDIITEDGSQITIENAEELREILKECGFKPFRRPGAIVKRCVNLVFPVTVNLPDGSSEVAEDAEELREIIVSWKEDNPDSTEKPKVAFPHDVTLHDSTVVTVNTPGELKRLIRRCIKHHMPYGPCFRLIFPITLDFPDGSSVEVESRSELDELISQWKEDNPDATDRPKIAFPHAIELPNGEEVVVESKERLKEILKRCVTLQAQIPRWLHDNECYEVKYPVVVEFPGGNTKEANSLNEVRELFYKWHKANSRAKINPKIQLPVTLILKSDSSEVEVESNEDLKTIHEACKE